MHIISKAFMVFSDLENYTGTVFIPIANQDKKLPSSVQ